MPIQTSAVEQAARRQTAFRAVNENIAKLTGLLTETGYNLFVCECSDIDCAESVAVTAEEYEAVRSDGTCFLVVPGHQQEGSERVVGGKDRFLVVEKVGRAGELAYADGLRRA